MPINYLAAKQISQHICLNIKIMQEIHPKTNTYSIKASILITVLSICAFLKSYMPIRPN